MLYPPQLAQVLLRYLLKIQKGLVRPCPRDDAHFRAVVDNPFKSFDNFM